MEKIDVLFKEDEKREESEQKRKKKNGENGEVRTFVEEETYIVIDSINEIRERKFVSQSRSVCVQLLELLKGTHLLAHS